MFKIIGGLCVVAATSKIGYKKADKYEKRLKDLKSFESALWLLKSEMEFSMPVLKDAFYICSSLVQKNVGDILLDVSNKLNEGIDVVAAWCDAIDKGEHSLNKEDVIIIKEFANALGTSDIKLQLENIANTVSRLKIRQENAMENYKKYCKMCKTLGVTSGILIVTLFI
ncbi:MAG: stage III sporulation protein AB [Clostridia bacterium]|nr:stage III sporulation protein AB [Clostridia bacterium]